MVAIIGLPEMETKLPGLLKKVMLYLMFNLDLLEMNLTAVTHAAV